MKLTRFERVLLVNQYRMLGALIPAEKDVYDHVAKAFAQGY
jgi:uncharacterized protein YfbU (UPF0304 family)